MTLQQNRCIRNDSQVALGKFKQSQSLAGAEEERVDRRRLLVANGHGSRGWSPPARRHRLQLAGRRRPRTKEQSSNFAGVLQRPRRGGEGSIGKTHHHQATIERGCILHATPNGGHAAPQLLGEIGDGHGGVFGRLLVPGSGYLQLHKCKYMHIYRHACASVHMCVLTNNSTT